MERNFCAALERALSYLEQWFDFSENNIACALQALSLKNMPTFQQIKTVAEVLKLTSVLNMDDDVFNPQGWTSACCATQ